MPYTPPIVAAIRARRLAEWMPSIIRSREGGPSVTAVLAKLERFFEYKQWRGFGLGPWFVLVVRSERRTEPLPEPDSEPFTVIPPTGSGSPVFPFDASRWR